MPREKRVQVPHRRPLFSWNPRENGLSPKFEMSSSLFGRTRTTHMPYARPYFCERCRVQLPLDDAIHTCVCGWPTPERKRCDDDVFRSDEIAADLQRAASNADFMPVSYCPGMIGLGWPVALCMGFDAPGSEKYAPILIPLGIVAWPVVFALDIGLSPLTLIGVFLYNCIQRKKTQPAKAEAERAYNNYIQHEVAWNGYIWRDPPPNPV